MKASDSDWAKATEQLQAIRGRRLVQFRMGYGVRLELDTREEHEITIGSPLRFQTDSGQGSGRAVSIEVAGALVPAIGTEVVGAEVKPDGSLRIQFPTVQIHVPADEKYEAWEARASNGLLIVCMPGGGLAIWAPDRQAP